MATCSYQSLARYNQDYSRHYRARNLNDIRIRQRQAILTYRLQLKGLKMLQNRRTLSGLFTSDETDFDESPQQQAPLTISSQSGNTDDWHERSQFEDWSQDISNSSWDEHSIEYSAQTTSSVNSVTLGDSQIPAYFFDTPKPSRQRVRTPTNHQHQYKLTDKSPSPSSSKNFLDHAKISNDFVALRDTIYQCCDTHIISRHIQENWPVLVEALKCNETDTVQESLNLISSLAAENLIQPQTILHMFQHGFIFSLRQAAKRMDEGIIPVITLLLNIIRSTPSSVPLMIDLISSSNVFNELEESIYSGTREVIRHATDFYYQVTELMMAQLYSDNQDNRIQPLIPDILLSTGVTGSIVESYSPISTIKKCISPKLISLLVKYCLQRSCQKDPALVKMALVVLANALKIAHLKSMSSTNDTEWLVTILCAFRDSKIESQLRSLCRGLDRLIKAAESSEHCSQGVNVDEGAAQTKQNCQEFMNFYESYYSFLSKNFAIQMNNTPAADAY